MNRVTRLRLARQLRIVRNKLNNKNDHRDKLLGLTALTRTAVGIKYVQSTVTYSYCVYAC